MSLPPFIFGHRGASAVAPENTLAAFSRAILDGADGIEFDVRLSRDGVPVVIHDASLRRTAGIDAQVGDLTAEQLRAIDVGRWFSRGSTESLRAPKSSYEGEKVPMLTQVFDLFTSNAARLYVEMKSESEEAAELAAAVVESIREAEIGSRVVVESFDLPAITEVKRIDPGIRTAALFEPRLSRPISTIRRLKMIDLALNSGAEEIAIHYTLAGVGMVEKAQECGLETVVWTVDDPKWVSRARRLGVKALITNDPAMMVRNRDNADPS